MATFDENGKYIKTDWKAGDKITAIKLNKIEESLEAINDNDISRHVEADARLDELESGAASDKQAINAKVDALEDVVDANKDAADLELYSINQHMTLLDKKIDDGVAEVEAIADTVDGKIAAADANMKAQIDSVNTSFSNFQNSVNTSFSNFQNSVNTQMNGFQNEVNTQMGNYLPLSGGSMNGVLLPSITGAYDLGSDTNRWGYLYIGANINVSNGVNTTLFGSDAIACQTKTLWLRGGTTVRGLIVDSDNLYFGTDGNGNWNLGDDNNRWRNLYLSDSASIGNLTIRNISGTFTIEGFTGSNDNPTFYIDNTSTVYARGIRPQFNGSNDLGNDANRWRYIYLSNSPNVSSDRSLKENIEYVSKAKSGLTYDDMYKFVRDDLGLATYNFIGQDKLQMNFIAQDLLVNSDGTDNKIGQMIVEPVAVPPEEEVENGTPYPTLSYDMGMYTSVLAGALKEAINKIEQLEARINELENK